MSESAIDYVAQAISCKDSKELSDCAEFKIFSWIKIGIIS